MKLLADWAAWLAGCFCGWLAGWLVSCVSTRVGGCWAVSLMFAGLLGDRLVDWMIRQLAVVFEVIRDREVEREREREVERERER